MWQFLCTCFSSTHPVKTRLKCTRTVLDATPGSYVLSQAWDSSIFCTDKHKCLLSILPLLRGNHISIEVVTVSLYDFLWSNHMYWSTSCSSFNASLTTRTPVTILCSLFAILHRLSFWEVRLKEHRCVYKRWTSSQMIHVWERWVYDSFLTSGLTMMCVFSVHSQN